MFKMHYLLTGKPTATVFVSGFVTKTYSSQNPITSVVMQAFLQAPQGFNLTSIPVGQLSIPSRSPSAGKVSVGYRS